MTLSGALLDQLGESVRNPVVRTNGGRLFASRQWPVGPLSMPHWTIRTDTAKQGMFGWSL